MVAPQLKVPVESNPGEMVGFMKLLLNKCQREFEQNKEDETEIDDMQKRIEAAPVS